MKVHFTYTLPNNIGFSVVEINTPIIRRNFNNRYQVVMIYNGEKIFPKNKKSLFKFEEKNNNKMVIKSDKNPKKILEVLDTLFYEKQLFDKSAEECNTKILEYLSLYNQDKELFFKTLRREYIF